MDDEGGNSDLGKFPQLFGPAVFVGTRAHDDGVEPGRVEQRLPVVD